FAATPRDHSQKVNKKMYRGAMQAILSELVRQERLVVVDSFDMSEPKTSVLLDTLSGLGFETGLIVTNELDENVYLASRNVPGVYTLDISSIDPVSLVAADKVIMTVDAVEKIQEWLG
ncbi:MAG: 50S ribosomal protein L4, partial [Lysobacterales bacterium]